MSKKASAKRATRRPAAKKLRVVPDSWEAREGATLDRLRAASGKMAKLQQRAAGIQNQVGQYRQAIANLEQQFAGVRTEMARTEGGADAFASVLRDEIGVPAEAGTRFDGRTFKLDPDVTPGTTALGDPSAMVEPKLEAAADADADQGSEEGEPEVVEEGPTD